MDLVKKDEKMVAPINPMMPFVPQILMSAMPTPIPQMKFEDGIIKNFFHNVKVRQMVKATEAEASIAENKRRYVASSLAMVEDITTFSARLELHFKKIRNEEEMMNIAKDTAQSQLVEQQLKNMLLQNEVKLSEVELKVKLKELEDILGGNNGTAN
jgi:hypothetical protein